MYIIKQKPEDFCVKEIFELDIKTEGEFSYFTLKKKNYNTLDAIQKITSKLRIPLKNIGFAGSKDKKAITEQTCSAKNISKEQLESISIKGIEINYLGKGNKPISLGAHSSNQFKITIRNIQKIPDFKTKFTNYFGEQRLSKNNAVIGKLLVQRKFKEAAQQLTENSAVLDYLNQNPTDFIGAIRQLPSKMLKFYIHAYQSELWNKMAKNSFETKLPIIGFATEQTEQTKKIFTEEQINTRDFIIKQLPDLSSEGGEREVYAEAKNLKICKLEDDELNAGMKKLTIEFELGKGIYATEFIAQSFL